MYLYAKAVFSHWCIKAVFILVQIHIYSRLHITVGGSRAGPHFISTWRKQPEWDLFENAVTATEFKQYTSSSAATSEKPAPLRRTQSGTREIILKGVLWNSKNSFAPNWSSNDGKWKWSCESGRAAARARVPTIPLGRRGRAVKPGLLELNGATCFIKHSGCLMMPSAASLGGVTLQYHGSEMNVLLLFSLPFLFLLV